MGNEAMVGGVIELAKLALLQLTALLGLAGLQLTKMLKLAPM